MIQCLMRHRGTCGFALILIISSGLAAAEPEVGPILKERINALSSSATPSIDGTPIAAIRGIKALYELRGWEPAWTEPAMIHALFDAVLRSTEHGLTPDDFHARELAAALRKNRGEDPVSLANSEIICTDALARLAFTLHFGKLDPEALDPVWNLSRSIDGRNVVPAINHVLDSGDISAALEKAAPNLPIYDQLRTALAQYRGIMARGGWPMVPDGKGMKIGANGSRVEVLRQRLRVTEDLGVVDPADPALYDEDVEAAVKRFQYRHGIDVDGKVGPRSLQELNVSVEARIDQIRANLERARWIFRDVEDTFIIVNIADYRLRLFQNQKLTWTTRVQVGKFHHMTPVFKSTLKYAELNPTWTIPPGILKKETLPAIRKDPSYLSRKNMSVVTHSGETIDPATINWDQPFRHMVRQEPGPGNALGQIKFIFPNKYMVYLHDTPSKSLFARSERAFSHGCIRTENPFELAERLFADQGWDRARLDKVNDSEITTRVHLDSPVTVMLLYWTAQVDEDGLVNFRKDIYNRDAPIIKGLADPFRIDPPEGIGSAEDSEPVARRFGG